jgi:hypothetical protein
MSPVLRRQLSTMRICPINDQLKELSTGLTACPRGSPDPPTTYDRHALQLQRRLGRLELQRMLAGYVVVSAVVVSARTAANRRR